MTSETPCPPECGCICGHDNDWHSLAVGACRSREHCNCSKFAARAHAPNCPNVTSQFGGGPSIEDMNAPKPAALASCGCRDRVDIPHALNCPENAKDVKPAEPQSEPRIEHRDVCHASYPCEDCGKVRSRAEGGTTFTVCDDCWDKRQSEPPIDFEQAAWEATHPTNDYLDLARAYLALKAERDALKASITKRDEIDASNLTDYNALLGENAALKVRVEDITARAEREYAQEGHGMFFADEILAIINRKQEASDGK